MVTVIGARAALDAHVTPVAVLILAVLTGVTGEVVRDVRGVPAAAAPRGDLRDRGAGRRGLLPRPGPGRSPRDPEHRRQRRSRPRAAAGRGLPRPPPAPAPARPRLIPHHPLLQAPGAGEVTSPRTPR
ncbi:TRIC cation channel family protein [Streptomyces sp. NBC_00249]|nr:TRIC cation channel family protein [Streptomyces sp. NBC_00249]